MRKRVFTFPEPKHPEKCHLCSLSEIENNNHPKEERGGYIDNDWVCNKCYYEYLLYEFDNIKRNCEFIGLQIEIVEAESLSLTPIDPY